MSIYNLKKNVEKRKAVANEIFDNLEDANQSTLTMYMLNHVEEYHADFTCQNILTQYQLIF